MKLCPLLSLVLAHRRPTPATKPFQLTTCLQPIPLDRKILVLPTTIPLIEIYQKIFLTMMEYDARLAYYSADQVFRVRIIPTEIHDVHQRWAVSFTTIWGINGLLNQLEALLLAEGSDTYIPFSFY
jgi:hypothetical protein